MAAPHLLTDVQQEVAAIVVAVGYHHRTVAVAAAAVAELGQWGAAAQLRRALRGDRIVAGSVLAAVVDSEGLGVVDFRTTQRSAVAAGSAARTRNSAVGCSCFEGFADCNCSAGFRAGFLVAGVEVAAKAGERAAVVHPIDWPVGRGTDHRHLSRWSTGIGRYWSDSPHFGTHWRCPFPRAGPTLVLGWGTRSTAPMLS